MWRKDGMKKNEVNQKNGVNININFLEIPKKQSLWDRIIKIFWIKNIND